MSHRTPGSKVQKGFCAWGILHFLLLTDLVGYRYGRGYKSVPFLEELCHWSERFVWRIALLLPVYQNVCSGKYWKQGGTTRFGGRIVHCLLASWGILFFVYQVIMNDIYKIPQFLWGVENTEMTMMFGWKYSWVWGYIGAVSYMWIFYAFSLTTGCLPLRYVGLRRQ